MISLALAVALLAAETPAAAQAAQTAPPAKAAPTPGKDGMICRKEAVLGSRMKSRVCMTQVEWDQRQQQDRDMLDQAQRNRPLVEKN